MKRHAHKRAGRWGASAAAAFALLSLARPLPARAEAPPGIEFVRTIRDFSTQTRMTANFRDQTMVAFENPENALTELRLRILDGRTMKTLRQALRPSLLLGIPPVYATNGDGTTLYLVAHPSSADRIHALTTSLLVVDASSLAVRSLPLTAFPAGFRVMGMTYSTSTRRIYAVAQISTIAGSDGNYTVAVAELDPATGAATWPGGIVRVRECQKAVRSSEQAGIAFDASNSRVFVGCGAGRFVSATQPGFPAVAQIDISDSTNPVVTLSQVAGSYQLGETLSDQGSGRYLMVSSSNGSPTQAVYVFDQKTAKYLGVVSAGDSVIKSVGINRLLGRLYIATHQGLLATSYTGLRIAQALRFNLPDAQPGVVSVVPFSRLFLVGTGFPTVFKAYRDNLPRFTEPVEDPDAGTVDIVERAGRTDATFSGEGSGFGFRVHHVGGIDGALQNVVANSANYWRTLHLVTGLPENPGDGDRDVHAARIRRARLSSDEANAESISLDGDTITRSDYSALSQGPWPYAGVHCSDHGNAPMKEEQETAGVACDRAGSVVTADSIFREGGLPADIAVGWAGTTVRIERTPTLGIKTIVDAEARNVQIQKDVHIGFMQSHAETVAHGRPGTAKAVYERSFRDVTTPAYSCSTECDAQKVLTSISKTIGAVFLAEMPEDERIETKRGARGSALRAPAGHQQDVAFNNQPEVERHIPALRLSMILDNSARSRLVIEFAGVQAVSTYQISLLAQDAGVPPLISPPALPGVSVPGVVRPARAGTPLPGISSVIDIPGRVRRWLLLGPVASLPLSSMWALLALPMLLGFRRRALTRVLLRSR